MFWKVGGFKLLLPYIAAISFYSYLELFRSKSIQKWANKVSKEQHEEFFNSCVLVFGATFISAGLIIVKVYLNMEMKLTTSK